MTAPETSRNATIAGASLGAGALAAGVMAAACLGPAIPPGEEVRSTRARITSDAPAEDVARLTADNAAFAARAHRMLARDRPNLVWSPHSVSIALAMTRVGARGQTAEQMDEALRFTLEPARLNAAFNTLDRRIASRERSGDARGGRPFRLRVANALFGQRGYRWLSPFLDTLAESYGAGLSTLDFAADTEAARLAINRWVSDRTERRIPELLQRGVLQNTTTLVLTNAVYFDASWDEPFDPAMTRQEPFDLGRGARPDVPMMHQQRPHAYAEREGWRAVELDYVGNQVSMVLALPPPGAPDAGASAVGEELPPDALTALIAGLVERRVTLAIPRFRFRTPAGLRDVLRSLGMRDAFDPGVADLSGMDGTRELFVQDVVHEGFISLDEAGTEAAAATAVIVGRTSAPEPATFIADRPFLFAIRDKPTGAVLFLGRVADPRG
jgi:serpin B